MPVNTTLAFYNTPALHSALVTALPGVVDSISAYGPDRPIDLWLAGQGAILSAPQQVTAQGIFDNHDPVFLSANKTIIQADGTETVTITVSAPKQGAAATTVICTKPDGTTLTQAVALTLGVGTTTLKTKIEGTYTITLQNPSNRTTDSLTIQAV
jgi:hypothetical protein